MRTTKPHRSKILGTALRLFRKKGYAGTGLNEILAESKAPKGSLYYYFPSGKEQIGAEGVRAAGRMVSRTLSKLEIESKSPCDFIRAYANLLAGWMEKSDFQDGCPISTILLEMCPRSESITEQGRIAFDAWCGILTKVFHRHGGTELSARRAAYVVLTSFEGALILSRVQGSSEPILETAEGLAEAFSSEPKGSG